MTHEHLRYGQSQSTADELFAEAITCNYGRGEAAIASAGLQMHRVALTVSDVTEQEV